MTLLTMYDAVTATNLPATADYAAAYVDGRYANLGAVKARCPHARILTITVLGGVADACDCEEGDLTVAQAVDWVERRLAAKAGLIVVYANQDRWVNQGLAAALAKYGRQIKRWLALYDNIASVPPGYDGKQYRSTQLLDTSVLLDNFFGETHAPLQPQPATDPEHYDRFPTKPFRIFGKLLSEQATVKKYDRLRAHPKLYKADLLILRVQLHVLAGRVWAVAHLHQPNGKPSWGQDYRGWRYQQLTHRAQGQKVA